MCEQDSQLLLPLQLLEAQKQNKRDRSRFHACSVSVIPKRFERLTYCLEGSCSIQLSYGIKIKDVFKHKNDLQTVIRKSFFVNDVGAARFELATSWSQTRRDDRTTLRPELLIVLFKRTVFL